MVIQLEEQDVVTLNESSSVVLDPDTLDCCGVNRPISNCGPCTGFKNIRAKHGYFYSTLDLYMYSVSGINAVIVKEDTKWQ